MNPITAIDLHDRDLEARRREALILAARTADAEPATPRRRARIRARRLLRRRLGTA